LVSIDFWGATMASEPFTYKPAESIDMAALNARYAVERDKRLRSDGQAQFQKLDGLVPDYANDPHLPIAPRDPVNKDIDVVVLGAGWGGIIAGYHLSQAGVTDVCHIDTAGDFGGVWYWNRYPGIQCDNDAYCYLPLLEEMGFLPSKKFADGAEIQAYAKSIAVKSGFADKALFHTQVNSIVWDAASQRWQVGTNRGDAIRARHVVVAAGVLNMPKLPGVPGIASFKGKMFHSARWDYLYTGGSYGQPELDLLADKVVAITGTGATAIQAVPHLAKYAKHLYVIQRTPSTVDERPNPPTDTEWAKSLAPGWQKHRISNFNRASMELFMPGDTDLIGDIWTEVNRNLLAQSEAEGWKELDPMEFFQRRDVIDAQVMERLRDRCDTIIKDKATADALKPWYNYMCKRPLSSDEFYEAFNRDNVTLLDVSDSKGLETMTEKGFVVAGQEYGIDCMIFASGFEVTSSLDRRWGIPTFTGKGGESIYDHWRDGPKTLHGVMTHGFPNQYYVGYIQGGANGTVTEQFGRQGAHAAYIIAECLKRGVKECEPSQDAQDAYVKTYYEIRPDISALQARCPPGYFNNEGEGTNPWGLFPGWGYGWDHFEAMLADWRDKGDMEGMVLTS
jgi:cation diffusion facilitator CzcD-associated flavoprotein CzcO